MSILQADCIDFRYPEKPLFSQASLQVCSGSMTGLLGSVRKVLSQAPHSAGQ